MNDKLDGAENVHRQALHAVIFDLRVWMTATIRDLRHQAKNLRKKSKMAESKSLHEQIDGIERTLAKLDELRQVHLLSSAAKRVQTLAINQLHEADVYEPTPEQIAAKCAEIRAGWTETEMANRHWQKVKPAEAEPITFIF